MYRYVPIIFLRVLYVGPGARLAAIFWGRGAQVRRHPGSTYLGHKPNVTWFKALCAGGGNVTFVA